MFRDGCVFTQKLKSWRANAKAIGDDPIGTAVKALPSAAPAPAAMGVLAKAKSWS